MRDRLIEAIGSKICEDYSPTCDEYEPHTCGNCYANNCKIGELADHLLADGWMRPPCKVGDKMYKIFTKYTPFVGEYVVEDYGIPTRDVLGHYLIIPFDEIGKTVFLTKEEAEKALKGGGDK